MVEFYLQNVGKFSIVPSHTWCLDAGALIVGVELILYNWVEEELSDLIIIIDIDVVLILEYVIMQHNVCSYIICTLLDHLVT